MRTRLCYLALLLFVSMTTFAQTPEGIQFSHDSMNVSLQKAKESGKLIFVDAFTTWCGPCKMMSNEVFVLPEVGKFFNANFINMKIDMEAGEGIELAKKFGIKAYPTFLLINGDGEIIHRVVGSSKADVFIEKIKRGMDPATSYFSVKKKYDAGERSIEFMPLYFKTMTDAYELKGKEEDVITYLTSLNLQQRATETNWDLFSSTVTDYKSPLFADFAKNVDTYRKAVGEDEVNNKIENIFYKELMSAGPTTDLKVISKTLKTLKVAPTSVIGYTYKLTEYKIEKKYQPIIDLYKNEIVKLEKETTKFRLEMMLSGLLKDAPADIKTQAITYFKARQESCQPDMVNFYKQFADILSK